VLVLERKKARKWKRKQRLWMKTWSDLSHGTVPKRTWNVFASHILFKRKTQS